MTTITKHVAIAKITDAMAVKAKTALMGGIYDEGAIFVDIPEIQLFGIYCRYGMSLPFVRVKSGDKLWVEPTVDGFERWIYTGFADCGGKVTPTILESVLFTNDSIEPYVLGNKLKDELQKIVDAIIQLKNDFSTWAPVPNDGGAALKAKVMAGFCVKPPAILEFILSKKIKGE